MSRLGILAEGEDSNSPVRLIQGTCYTWIPRQLRAHLLPLNAAFGSSRSSENNTSKMPSDHLSCETVSWWCFKCLETPSLQGNRAARDRSRRSSRIYRRSMRTAHAARRR